MISSFLGYKVKRLLSPDLWFLSLVLYLRSSACGLSACGSIIINILHTSRNKKNFILIAAVNISFPTISCGYQTKFFSIDSNQTMIRLSMGIVLRWTIHRSHLLYRRSIIRFLWNEWFLTVVSGQRLTPAMERNEIWSLVSIVFHLTVD